MPFVPWPAVVHTPPMPLDETHVTPWTKQPGGGIHLNVSVRGPLETTAEIAETMAAAEKNEISPYKLAAVGSDGAITLRPYQTEALAALDNAWQEGRRAPLIVLPTGAGKTIVAAQSMNRLFQTLGTRSLFLAHRKELLDQTAEKIRLVSPRMRVGIVQAKRNEMGRDVTIASIQTLGHRSEARLNAIIENGPYGLVVCDEAHHAVSPQWMRVLNALKEAYPQILLYGMTATPGRADGVALDRVFDDVCFYRSLQSMIDLGYLVPPKGYKVTLDIDLDTVDTSNGDFVKKQLSQLMNTPSVVRAIVRAWCEFGHDRKTIVFAVDIAHAHALSEEFQAAGYKAEAVDSKTKKRERAAIFKRYRSGETKILCQCEIATEGFDDPSTEAILHARPTQSQSLYIQCLDAETEVLTKRGWVGVEGVSPRDEAAQYDPSDGLVSWSPVLGIVRRRLGQETMYGIKNPHIDVRVTAGHQMLSRGRRSSQFDFHRADSLSSVYENVLPVSGTQDPPGAGAPLTNDELVFLGLWYADGSYHITTRQLYISAAINSPVRDPLEEMLDRCSIKWGCSEPTRKSHFECNGRFYDYERPVAHYYISYGEPRGRGRGVLRGWKYLEEWIHPKKTLPSSFETLNRDQLLAFLSGLNAGDGAKMRTATWSPKTMVISMGHNRDFADRLQSLCVRRAVRCNLSVADKGKISLHIAPHKNAHSLSRQSDGRPLWGELPSSPEELVWCIETTLNTIVTRRNGKVAVMGNCTGRGLRPFPAKTECIVIDCVGNSERHSIMQLASLSGFDPERALHGAAGDGEEPEVGDDTPEVIGAEISGEEIELTNRANQRSRYTWRQASLGWILQIPRIGYYLVAWHDRQHTKSIIRFYDQRPGRRDDPPRDVMKDPVSFEIAYQMVEAECDRIFNARMYRKTAEFRDKDEPDEMPPEINFVDIDDGLDEPIHIPESFMLKDAKWRNNKASAKQLGLLKKLGVKEKTMPEKAGEASDLIAILQVERDAKMRLPPTPKQVAYLRINGLGSAKTKGAAGRKIWQHRKATQ